jgi:hypothetical protein
VSGAGPALSACSVGSSTIGRLPTPSLRVVLSGAGRRHLTSVRARRRYRDQDGCRDAGLESHPEASASTAPPAVIGIAISCTDQVARLFEHAVAVLLAQRDLIQSIRPKADRSTGSSGPAVLPATTQTPTTRRWTGAVRGDSPGTVAVCDGGAMLAASLSIHPRQAGPLLL